MAEVFNKSHLLNTTIMPNNNKKEDHNTDVSNEEPYQEF